MTCHAKPGAPRSGVARHRAGTIPAGAEVLRDEGPAGKGRTMPIVRPSHERRVLDPHNHGPDTGRSSGEISPWSMLRMQLG